LPYEPILTADNIPQITQNKSKIRIFKPPYLIHGNRPIIKRWNIEIDNSEEIKKYALICPKSTTHCVNIEQRCIGLEFEIKSKNILDSNIPDNYNLDPPFYYMLFLSNDKRVPLIAYLINLLIQ
jgi:hypothetical protein